MGRSILRNEKLISCHFSVYFSRYLLDILVVLTVLHIEGRVLICEEEIFTWSGWTEIFLLLKAVMSNFSGMKWPHPD